MQGRSIWTGKQNDRLTEIRLDPRPLLGNGPAESPLLVEPEHEDEVRAYLAYARRSFRAYGTLFVGGAVLASSGAFLSVAWPWAIWLVAVGLLVLGISILKFPFATPETNRMFGMRPSRTIVRIGGVLLIGMAAWVAVVGSGVSSEPPTTVAR